MKIDFTGLLFLLFLALKLLGFIEWSWIWITAPLWIPVMFIILIVAFLGIVTLLKTPSFAGGTSVKKS